MKNLESYTNHFRDIENVYYLNKRGRELVGCEKVVAKTLQYQHTLMRNDIYIHFGNPKLWQNEYMIPTPEFSIVTDAIFSVNRVQYFLEVDRMQKMNQNLEKLKKYYRFKQMELWQKHNGGKFPIVVFYTTKESRKNQLIESNPGLDLLVHTKEDLLL
jgi:hypothetical protein